MMWSRDGAGIADGSLAGKVDKSMLTADISVEAQTENPRSVLGVYRTFTLLRNTYPALAQGKMERHPVYNNDNTHFAQIAAWYMTFGEERMLVVHNFSERAAIMPFEDSLDKPVALNGTAEVKKGDVTSQLQLGGLSSVVFDL